MRVKIIEEFSNEDWDDFPMRYEIDPIRPSDIPPKRTAEGDFIFISWNN